jgi:uncharacterized linocin/CFP29 family protein
MDYIANGQAFGGVAQTMLQSGWDVQALRPFVGPDGRSYITRNARQNDGTFKQEAVLTRNDAAILWRQEWMQIDQAVIRAARAPRRVVADLRAAGLTYNIPNGMGKTVLETGVAGDITGATVSMDPARKSEGDRPQYDIRLLPLPVIHKDFEFTARQLEVSRSTGMPLDTTMIEMAGRKVAEEAEKMALGTSAFNGFSYGGGKIQGLTTFDHRETFTMTAPTDSAWTPELFITEVLAMRQKAIDNLATGPWVLYLSPDWGQYLDEDFKQFSDRTLRERLQAIDGLGDVRVAWYLTGFQAILVQMTSDVIREVIGMDVTTLQWATNGGMTLNFKVMAIMVPQIRADIQNRSGIVHGNAV